MASMIYAAKHVSSSDKAIPLFTLKGLPNLAPACISALDIVGIPAFKQVAFTQYADNIAYFIAATAKKIRYRVDGSPVGRLDLTERLPINAPVLKFSLKTALKPDQIDKYLKNLGQGATTERTGKTIVFSAPNLPDRWIDTVAKTSNSGFNAGRDFVNPDGLKAYHFISGTVNALLRVHTYAAVRNRASQDDKSIVDIQSLVSDPVSESTHRSFANSDLTSMVVKRKYSVSLANATDGDDMDIEGSNKYLESLKSAKTFINVTGVDSVLWAKPSPFQTSDVNIGSPSDVPSQPGILFPYFEGLVQPDASGIRMFVARHFLRLLGTNMIECREEYLKLRRGISSLATTPVGMVLSHILLGIELALNTQGRCFLIVSNSKYSGFVLLGEDLCVFDGSRWHVSSSETLPNDLLALDPHHHAAENLCRLFASMTASGHYNGNPVTMDDLKLPATTIDILQDLNVQEMSADTTKEVNQYLRRLNFMGKGYRAKDPQTIAEAIEQVLSDRDNLTIEGPTYIPELAAVVPLSREFVVLSSFGPDAPSLWNEKGKVIRCELGTADPNAKKSQKTSTDTIRFANMPERLLITPKPLSVAIRDMRKVVETKSVKMDFAERAGGFRNISIVSEPVRKRIWGALIDLDDVESPKKKQKTGQGVDDEIDVDALMKKMLE
jgi:hypothetical protein